MGRRLCTKRCHMLMRHSCDSFWIVEQKSTLRMIKVAHLFKPRPKMVTEKPFNYYQTVELT